MCTDFCVCPGAPTDKHYIQYSKVPDETYKKFSRSFLVPNDASINQLLWDSMPVNSNSPLKDSPTSDNMLKCYENAQTIAAEMAKLPGSSQADADKKKAELEAAKPPQTFVDIVSHVESKYKCSGLCESPLFYFT